MVDLISAWRGAELAPARYEALIARLEGDQEFLQAFVEEIRMLGMLKAVQSTAPRWLALHEAIGWGEPTEAVGELEEEDRIMGHLRESAPLRLTRSLRWGFGALAATILLSFLAWAAWPQKGRIGPDWNRTAANEPGEDLAVLSKLEGVTWESSDGRGPSEGSLLPSGRFRLRSGSVVLVFLNGVTLTLEGPADIDLVSINRVFCRQGRLRARVPKGVEGFVVAGRESAVVDLGTEFAMNVEPNGKSRVMVFEGAAKASLLDPKGFTRRTQRVEENKQFDVDPGSGLIAESVARPEEFISTPHRRLPSLRLSPSYANSVRKSQPLGYWRFGTITGLGVPNEVLGGPPLRPGGQVRIESDPDSDSNNKHAAFVASAPESYLTTDSPWMLSRGSRHAIEFWFLSESINCASLVGLYPAENNLPRTLRYKHFMLVEATAYPTLSLEKPASVRFLRRWLRSVDLAAEDDSLFSQRNYVPGRWHHVVAQRNGEQMELYVDGVRDHATTSESDPPGILYHLVVGRRTAEPTQLQESRPFVGRMDELALYDHPLSQQEVLSHFRLAAPESEAR
ncbi:LamG-like jellyroll fold domain-containing protein [Singulisphaera sp. PoT]|uniref:LamG-like jellyroll fold domain-containing protein n=1 Tax=Singulisphaera sp. PoT TaxID=3411797 RepID=UPI003BF58E1C